MSERVFLGLGSNLSSNLSEPASNIQMAIEHLKSQAALKVLGTSSLYVSPPMGPQDQPDFVNAVLELNTSLIPDELLALCKSIEDLMGREPTERWGPRVIDIDILLYGDQIIQSKNLNIPHLGIAQRSFVLYPLAGLDKDLQVPGLGSLTQLIDQLGESEIRRL
jgi:2-amino-4-hydroxy-6-hydroxymethyldihydropteridine diphosphokinase